MAQVDMGHVALIGGFILFAVIVALTFWTRRGGNRRVSEQGTAELYDKLAREREERGGS